MCREIQVLGDTSQRYQSLCWILAAALLRQLGNGLVFWRELLLVADQATASH